MDAGCEGSSSGAEDVMCEGQSIAIVGGSPVDGRQPEIPRLQVAHFRHPRCESKRTFSAFWTERWTRDNNPSCCFQHAIQRGIDVEFLELASRGQASRVIQRG